MKTSMGDEMGVGSKSKESTDSKDMSDASDASRRGRDGDRGGVDVADILSAAKGVANDDACTRNEGKQEKFTSEQEERVESRCEIPTSKSPSA